MRAHTAVALVVGLLAIHACGRAAAPVEVGVAPDAGASVGATQVAGRTVIRTARLEVEVADLSSGRTRALEVASALGATVEREEQEQRAVRFRLRVPESRLDPALDTLGTLGRVRQRSSAAEDRSAFAADLDARIKNLIASRDRLRALHARAANVNEVIAVERELARVQGELDGLEAQLKLLHSQAAMSTADLVLHQRIVLGPVGLIAKGTVNLVSRLIVWR